MFACAYHSTTSCSENSIRAASRFSRIANFSLNSHRHPPQAVAHNARNHPHNNHARSPRRHAYHSRPAPFLKPAYLSASKPASIPEPTPSPTLASIADAALAPPSSPARKRPPAHQRTVCVSNLPANMSKASLRALFAQHGLVRRIECSGGGAISADIEYEHAASAAKALRAAADAPPVLAGVELVVFRPVRAAAVSTRLPEDGAAEKWRRKHPDEARAEVMVLVVRGFGPLMGAQDLANKFAAYGRAYGVDIHPMRLFAQIALPGNDTLADEIITECEHDPLVVRGRIVEVKKGAYWGQKWIDVSQKGKQASQNKKLNPEAIDVTYETVVPETRPEVSELMAKERQSRRAERWEQGHLKSRQAKMNDTVSKAEEMRLEWLAQLDEKLTEGKKAGTQEREEQQAAVTEETEPSIAKT